MVITPHAAAGALIGSGGEKRSKTLLLAASSHFLLDAVPHQDYSFAGPAGRARLAADAVAALIVVAAISRQHDKPALVWASAAMAVAPDVLSVALARRGRSTGWHDWSHAKPASTSLGLAAQFILASAAGLKALSA